MQIKYCNQNDQWYVSDMMKNIWIEAFSSVNLLADAGQAKELVIKMGKEKLGRLMLLGS